MVVSSILFALSSLGPMADGPKAAPSSPGYVERAAAIDPAKPGEAWQLTLREAIKIGLENSDVIRVVSLGAGGVEEAECTRTGAACPTANHAPMVIARLNADASAWNFKAAVLAHVRSVEQQYWALASQHVQLWARETAVKLCKEILAREQAELAAGRGNAADVAEAQQSVENAQLSYITATSDLITTERQLRNILGLPAADDRRIIPSTPATEAKVDPDWKASLAEMNEHQPDIAQQKALVRHAEMRVPADPGEGIGHVSERPGFAVIAGAARSIGQPNCGASPPVAATSSDEQVRRQREFLGQVVHQSSHSLARFLLEIDANHRQFQTARRLREAAQTRLESARAYYEGRRAGFTVDRVLDAVNGYANALAQEAQFKMSYNTSIAAFSEAKGTLLEDRDILVADGPVKAVDRVESQVVVKPFEIPPTTKFDFDIDFKPARFQAPSPVPVESKAKGTVVKYQITIETGSKTMELHGTISTKPKGK